MTGTPFHSFNWEPNLRSETGSEINEIIREYQQFQSFPRNYSNVIIILIILNYSIILLFHTHSAHWMGNQIYGRHRLWIYGRHRHSLWHLRPPCALISGLRGVVDEGPHLVRFGWCRPPFFPLPPRCTLPNFVAFLISIYTSFLSLICLFKTFRFFFISPSFGDFRICAVRSVTSDK